MMVGFKADFKVRAKFMKDYYYLFEDGLAN